jgi:hypothetical protein
MAITLPGNFWSQGQLPSSMLRRYLGFPKTRYGGPEFLESRQGKRGHASGLEVGVTSVLQAAVAYPESDPHFRIKTVRLYNFDLIGE